MKRFKNSSLKILNGTVTKTKFKRKQPSFLSVSGEQINMPSYHDYLLDYPI